MRRQTVLLCVVAALVLCGTSLAEENAEAKKSNVQLRQRVKELEEKVGALTEKKTIWSNLDIQLYGYIKGDASYDDSRTETGNYVRYVDDESLNDGDGEFNITARETRLGAKITGPSVEGVNSSGRVEIDFYGGGDENKAGIQMRHAYLELACPKSNFSILAGQTSDVISPLAPTTLNYTVLWNAGNIGYRRPQIRATKVFRLGGETEVNLQAALARTIGTTRTVTGSESGEDADFPTVQWRAGAKGPWFCKEPTSMGVSGHFGREEYDITTTGVNRDIDTWSVNFDFSQRFCSHFALKCELFTGENLSTYFGGIGQGVAPSTGIPTYTVGSRGGWLAGEIGPIGKFRFNVGAGIDDVDDADVAPAPGLPARTQNTVVFGNAIYAVNENADVGLELSHWRTNYKGTGTADDLRLQASFIYKF